MNAMNMLKAIILIQLFFSAGITILSYAIPDAAQNTVTMFSGSGTLDIESVGADVEDSLQKQTEVPVIELGALVFYSGNILLDFLLNFVFAIPEMIGMLINGIMLLLNVDSYIFAIVEIFAAVVVVVMYFLALISFLMSLRSGTAGAGLT